MTITKQAAEGLATVINDVRPDWETAGILEAIRKVREHSLADVAIAAVLAATVPTNRTPAVIAMQGNHWRDVRAATTSEADRHPSGAANTALCTHCARTADHCQAPGVQAQDPHEFRTAHDLAVERARQHRRPEPPEWTPDGALRAGGRMPDRYRREMQAAIDAAKHAGRPETGPVAPGTVDPDPTYPHDPQNAQEAAT